MTDVRMPVFLRPLAIPVVDDLLGGSSQLTAEAVAVELLIGFVGDRNDPVSVVAAGTVRSRTRRRSRSLCRSTNRSCDTSSGRCWRPSSAISFGCLSRVLRKQGLLVRWSRYGAFECCNRQTTTG